MIGALAAQMPGAGRRLSDQMAAAFLGDQCPLRASGGMGFGAASAATGATEALTMLGNMLPMIQVQIAQCGCVDAMALLAMMNGAAAAGGACTCETKLGRW